MVSKRKIIDFAHPINLVQLFKFWSIYILFNRNSNVKKKLLKISKKSITFLIIFHTSKIFSRINYKFFQQLFNISVFCSNFLSYLSKFSRIRKRENFNEISRSKFFQNLFKIFSTYSSNLSVFIFVVSFKIVANVYDYFFFHLGLLANSRPYFWHICSYVEYMVYLLAKIVYWKKFSALAIFEKKNNNSSLSLGTLY